MKHLFFFGLGITAFSMVLALFVIFIPNYQNNKQILNTPSTISTGMIANDYYSEEMNPDAQVLGAQSDIINLDRFYGLINGYRRDNYSPALTVHLGLQAAAQKILTEKVSEIDIQEIAKSYGYTGKNISSIKVNSESSSWSLFSALTNDPKYELLIRSSAFYNMGLASECISNSESTTQCQSLFLIGD